VKSGKTDKATIEVGFNDYSEDYGSIGHRKVFDFQGCRRGRLAALFTYPKDSNSFPRLGVLGCSLSHATPSLLRRFPQEALMGQGQELSQASEHDPGKAPSARFQSWRRQRSTFGRNRQAQSGSSHDLDVRI